jgi:hypothetical protein
MMLQHAVAAVLSAVVLAPFSFYAGRAANLLRLPQITGYLVSGVICGPYVLGILSTTALSDLNIIEGACLSIIGLAAGAELYLADLHAIRRQVCMLMQHPSPMSCPDQTHLSGVACHGGHLGVHMAERVLCADVVGHPSSSGPRSGASPHGSCRQLGCNTHDCPLPCISGTL